MKVKLLLLLATVCLWLTTCSESNYNTSTRMNSKSITSQDERIRTLRKEINAPTDFYDAKFQLFNVNGFSNSRASLPGASSWDYKFVVKLDTGRISLWLEEFNPEGYDQSWVHDLTKHMPERWSRADPLEMYKRPGQDVMIILYRSEGILFKRVLNH